MNPWSPSPSSFALTPSRDDTALFQDARIRFSHLVPGRPALGTAGRPGEPAADAVLHLQDAPVAVRYRVEAPAFAAASARDLARLTVEHFATQRARAEVVADRANETWLASWGVEAAAVVAYEVPASATETTTAREDAFVLVRQGAVLTISWTYPVGFLDDPAYATFASIAEATMVWDPLRWDHHGQVWPAGEFLGPGLYGTTMPKYDARAKELGTAPLLPDERVRLLAVLSGVVSLAGAPWVPVTAEVRDSYRRAILGAVRNERVRGFVEEAFVDVRTAHDLRGLAILIGRAVDRHASSAPPSALTEQTPSVNASTSEGRP